MENSGLTLVAADLTLQVPVLRGEEPLDVSFSKFWNSAAYLSNATANRRDKRQNKEQDKKVQDLSVDLSLDRRTLDRRIPAFSAMLA
jgi:hypothetical protein